MSQLGHSLQIVARRKSLYVRCSLKATQSQSLGTCHDGSFAVTPCNRPVMMVARCCRSIAWAALAFERGFPAITFDVHFQDCGVVHEPVDSRQRHGLVTEHR